MHGGAIWNVSAACSGGNKEASSGGGEAECSAGGVLWGGSGQYPRATETAFSKSSALSHFNARTLSRTPSSQEPRSQYRTRDPVRRIYRQLNCRLR
jgi:hypothetical protein